VIKQTGVALVIAMILLLILTVLAITGMSMSTAELVMAGNEQFHRQAFDAAGDGIEAAIAQLSAGASQLVAEVTAENYIATTRYAGDESNLPEFSAGKLVGRHFEIESTGGAARDASDEQIQGVMVIAATNGVSDYGQIGTGLQGAGSP